jgi:hypothetical protein
VSLQRGLQRLDGVDQAKLILKPPHMAVKLKPGAWVDPAKMTDTIRRAGYTPMLNDVRLTVTGKVEPRGEALVLVLDQMKTPLELTAASHPSAPEAAPALARHAGAMVEVEGYWTSQEPKKLAVTRTKAPSEPGGKPSE